MWENSGTSPTRDLVVRLYCPPLGPLTIKNPNAAIDKGTLLPLLLGPKQSSWGGTCNYSAKQLSMVRDNGYHLYIAAMATYFDIFDAPHKTEACIELSSITGDLENMDATLRTSLSTCGRNCADKECDKVMTQ